MKGAKSDVALITRCVVSTTPNSTAAILLYRICLWSNYTRVRKKGHLWIAKTRYEWTRDTGLTLDQYKSNVSQLIKNEFIELKQFIFAGRKVSHIRLLEKGKNLLDDSKWVLKKASDLDEAEGAVKPPLGGWEYPTGGLETPQSLQGVVKGVVKGDSCAPKKGTGNYIPKQGLINPGKEKKDSKKLKNSLDLSNQATYTTQLKEELMPSIADKLKSPSKKPVNKNQVGIPFHSMWSKLVSEFTGEYQIPLTQKKKGQLGHFKKFCPQGHAEIVLATMIDDWHVFTKRVESATGIFTLPAKPQIAFALSHVQHAVTFWQEQEGLDPITLQPIPEPEVKLQLTAIPKPVPYKKSTSEKASPEELNSILFGDDDVDC